jgi:hypothetical protein
MEILHPMALIIQKKVKVSTLVKDLAKTWGAIAAAHAVPGLNMNQNTR